MVASSLRASSHDGVQPQHMLPTINPTDTANLEPIRFECMHARCIRPPPRPEGVSDMTRMRVASLNMSGAQDRGAWAHFLHACAQWVKREKVHMIMGQEHNLDPAREGECRRMAERKGLDKSGDR